MKARRLSAKEESALHQEVQVIWDKAAAKEWASQFKQGSEQIRLNGILHKLNSEWGRAN